MYDVWSYSSISIANMQIRATLFKYTEQFQESAPIESHEQCN